MSHLPETTGFLDQSMDNVKTPQELPYMSYINSQVLKDEYMKGHKTEPKTAEV